MRTTPSSPPLAGRRTRNRWLPLRAAPHVALALVLVGTAACARTRAAVTTGAPAPSTARAFLISHGASATALACFDGRRLRGGSRCRDVFGASAAIELPTGPAVLGAAHELESEDGCNAELWFDLASPSSGPSEEGTVRYGAYPDAATIAFHAARAPRDVDAEVSSATRAALVEQANAYVSESAAESADADVAVESEDAEYADESEDEGYADDADATPPPSDVVTSVDVRQRHDEDVDGDGHEDHLYVVEFVRESPDGSLPTVLVLLEIGGERPRWLRVVAADSATFVLRGTLDLDGRAPRELLYDLGYEGRITTVGTLVDGEVQGLPGVGCDY